MRVTNSERRLDVRGRKAEVEQRRARLRLVCQSPHKTTHLSTEQSVRARKYQVKDEHIPALTGDLDAIKDNLSETARANSQVYSQLVHARRVLVSEAISIFGIQRIDSMDTPLSAAAKRRGRGPDGRSSSAEEEWEIAGLQMPSPERFTGIFFCTCMLAARKLLTSIFASYCRLLLNSSKRRVRPYDPSLMDYHRILGSRLTVHAPVARFLQLDESRRRRQ